MRSITEDSFNSLMYRLDNKSTILQINQKTMLVKTTAFVLQYEVSIFNISQQFPQQFIGNRFNTPA